MRRVTASQISMPAEAQAIKAGSSQTHRPSATGASIAAKVAIANAPTRIFGTLPSASAGMGLMMMHSKSRATTSGTQRKVPCFGDGETPL